MSTGVSIHLQKLAKLYGGAAAVQDVDFSVEPGEFVSFLGPSGSGKTTTLMMIAGFVAPTRGQIFIDGQPVAHLPPQKRGLGMVFQNYALFPHMTVAENIGFPLKMRGIERETADRQVRDALAMVKLTGFEERYPRQLSGGQQQRVALARAIVFEPKVLLMDEPLGALDKKLREHMQLEIKHIQNRLGVTVIYVTHDQDEALTMSDRVVVMRDGRVEQIGSPASLYNDPETAFVADFLGESNFIEGRAEAAGDGLVRIGLPNGLATSGLSKHPVQEGASVRACLRPERVAVHPAMDPPTAEAWAGRIEEVIYVGDATKLRIGFRGQALTAKIQNTQDSARFSVGDEVVASWAAASVKILSR